MVRKEEKDSEDVWFFEGEGAFSCRWDFECDSYNGWFGDIIWSGGWRDLEEDKWGANW